MSEDERPNDRSSVGEADDDHSRSSGHFHDYDHGYPIDSSPEHQQDLGTINDGAGAWPTAFDDPFRDVDPDTDENLTSPKTGKHVDVEPEAFTDESFWLDARPGHGAQSMTEDWVRANHGPISHDGRSVTRTTFYPSDASTKGPGQAHRKPHQVRTWAKLASWNDGERSPERATQNFDADKRRWVETFAGQLDCTSYQKERAQWIIERLDLSPFPGAHIAVEEVILGILSLLMDADVPTTLPTGDELDELDINDVRASERPMMRSLMADLGMDRRDLKHVRQLLHKNARALLKPESQRE